MEVMGKQCKSSLKAQVQWSQRGWRKEWPSLRTAQNLSQFRNSFYSDLD